MQCRHNDAPFAPQHALVHAFVLTVVPSSTAYTPIIQAGRFGLSVAALGDQLRAIFRDMEHALSVQREEMQRHQAREWLRLRVALMPARWMDTMC